MEKRVVSRLSKILAMVTRLLQKEGTIYTESLLHTCSRKCPLSYPKKESSHSDSRALALLRGRSAAHAYLLRSRTSLFGSIENNI
jgi:hypothetical protein